MSWKDDQITKRIEQTKMWQRISHIHYSVEEKIGRTRNKMSKKTEIQRIANHSVASHVVVIRNLSNHYESHSEKSNKKHTKTHSNNKPARRHSILDHKTFTNTLTLQIMISMR